MSQALSDMTVHHVGISVRNLEEAIDFWCDIFGFEVDFRIEIAPIKAKIAFIKRDGFRIEFFEIEGSSPAPTSRLKPNTDLETQGTKHICFAVDDVQAALEQLHARGVRIVGIMRGHGRPMAAEDDPRLTPDKPPAAAFFFLDVSDTLVEIVRRSDFSS
ncbi:VOC family protein [Rhizobium sp. L1K21]|uniref:VOC family protein n=1 Tax=Rhizobium sp. L1K21 TaxID=2954933 RepID=UPI0020926F8B|nr:VOC family protein [Rhizobium sp. L1K21]MCO6187596.1 VOC family protein [Rhizobium sp. L1K21]